MRNPKTFFYITFLSFLFVSFTSCNKKFDNDDYTAYFGGEVINPINPYIILSRDSKVIDTIRLKENNTFFAKFDSLTPGLYTFSHEPEYQYVYFDKNDSLMVHINSKEFDESIMFCGRGDEKNNFLMNVFLKNEKDKEAVFEQFDYDIKKFNQKIDSSYSAMQHYYKTRKEKIKWSEEFDVYAQASINFPYYTKKELYPMVHKNRTGNDIFEKLPKNYYSYRKKIDFNNYELTSYAPFVQYLSQLLNNLGAISYHNHFSLDDLALKTNINKLKIADTLIKNQKVKNSILNNIAYMYLLEDQNMYNKQRFLTTYFKYSTDKSQENEIIEIGNAIQFLKPGNTLPDVCFTDTDNNIISLSELPLKNTVFFFWSVDAYSHLLAVHKKAKMYHAKYPNYNFIGVNLDSNQKKWKENLYNLNYDGITELRCTEFNDLKTKWAILKIHRAIVLNNEGTIKNAFTNMFNVDFENNLK